MTIWLDAQISPAIAPWIASQVEVEVKSARDLGLLYATDTVIFSEAKSANVIVMTKDSDFVEMVVQNGPPPQLLWLRCGNTSNAALREILSLKLTTALQSIQDGQAIVEIDSDLVESGS